MPLNKDWKYLSNLTLTDSEFGVPGSVDIVLGADVFSSRTVLQGRRFGPSGSPSAIKTTLGWVLAGSVGAAGIRSKQQEANYCPAVTAPDDRSIKEILLGRALQFTACCGVQVFQPSGDI